MPIAAVGRRVIESRGTLVTFRTWTKGAKDPEYGDPTYTPTDKEIKAIHDFPHTDRRAVDESGEEFLVASVFHVLPEDAPELIPGERRPRIVADGVTYTVKSRGPARGGQRELLCQETR